MLKWQRLVVLVKRLHLLHTRSSSRNESSFYDWWFDAFIWHQTNRGNQTHTLIITAVIHVCIQLPLMSIYNKRSKHILADLWGKQSWKFLSGFYDLYPAQRNALIQHIQRQSCLSYQMLVHPLTHTHILWGNPNAQRERERRRGQRSWLGEQGKAKSFTAVMKWTLLVKSWRDWHLLTCYSYRQTYSEYNCNTPWHLSVFLDGSYWAGGEGVLASSQHHRGGCHSRIRSRHCLQGVWEWLPYKQQPFWSLSWRWGTVNFLHNLSLFLLHLFELDYYCILWKYLTGCPGSQMIMTHFT